MGEYMEASIFKEINPHPFFSSKKDILFEKIRKAKSQEEKNLIAMEFALYDVEKKVNLIDLMNPIFWSYNNKNYVTYDGIFGLYDIFPPIHQYYKYYMPDGWLALIKSEEFELSKNFGKVVMPMNVIKNRLDLLLKELDGKNELKAFFTNEIKSSNEFNSISIFDMIQDSNDNDYLYLSLGLIYHDFEEQGRNIPKEIEIIQNKRNGMIQKYNLNKYMSFI